ncbi:Ger(x)C family spore germination protein [Bacillus taeanensis]|uniref:Ger(X)C family spore germination protein n=1 Tax=Bacillus taeanensis TaxID=273032 RepID=A0A366XSU8_9BACI|nr:Ger(x)C family spore germination protein [Bacillus taeanensis]RBW68746.1 Ger(x)C family spore germination protein [Bacillus taeanensis]
MKRKWVVGLVFLLILNLLTGCWSRRELNDLAIMTAVGIDKGEEENSLLMTVQVVNPGEVASQAGATNRTPVSVYQEEADTVFEAIRKMSTVMPRKLYWSHLRMVVIGEELAKEVGINKVLDFLSRDHELRTDFYLVVTKEAKAEDIVKILTHADDIPANKLFTSLEISQKAWAPSVSVALDELISDLVSDGKHPVLTGLKMIGDPKVGAEQKNVETTMSETILKYSGIAMFKDDKLKAWLNESQSKGYNYIMGKVESTAIDVKCPKGGKLVIELIRTDTEVKAKVKDGKPEITVDLFAEGNVGEVQCSIDLTKTETIEKLNTGLEKDIQSHMKDTIDKAKEEGTDIFGFGEAVHRSNPKEWKKLKKEWDEAFQELKVTINIDGHIRRTGTVGNSFLEEADSDAEK